MIYLDYHATTPVDPSVADYIYRYMVHEFGNASSIDHESGDRAEAAVKAATRHVADLVGATPRDILFTSGATESLNLAIQGTVNHLASLSPGRGGGGEGKPRIAISNVEHKAVLDTCDALHKQGRIELIHIPVDTQARLDLDQLEKACASGIHLLCIMAANNEVGTIYPIEKIAHIAQRYQVPLLCDASQAVGKIPIQFNEWGITMLAMSAHKLYGPQGVGALIVRRDHRLEPLLYGGGQQRGLRPGTFNLPGIVGLGEACRLRAEEMAEDEVEIGQKRELLQTLLQAQIPDLVINGDPQNRLAGNLHISIPGIPNSAIIARVRYSLAISTGSACSSGVETPSHVLRAMGLAESVVEGALRIGLGKFSTDDDIHQAAEILIQAVQGVKQVMA
ncbi:cysteine desulfurase [Nodosilinea sp. LEGE 07088]|uniref:cysteine desulfurase family protein n=1 Tax=Nodosilinea sp. LEGE 07088 TaxID=2777968 RepID=UPI00187DF67E|nr:cysteine desulfurase family protein [Nodosilinea sp. LEGE 07088]MBE9137370.1 cysteine desulfurase [Nodosilinea sp. LEGE 07088]